MRALACAALLLTGSLSEVQGRVETRREPLRIGITLAAEVEAPSTEQFNWDPIVASMTREDVLCLVHNIYFEARNQSTLGQEAVAWVTFNRVADPNYADTVCEVVWDPGDFSWTNDGKSDIPDDRAALERAVFVAVDVMKQFGKVEDPTHGSVFYHASYVDPWWTASVEQVVQIDDHIFYREKENS